MSKRKIQNRTEVLKGLSVPTLFKLAALQADAGHDGKFTIFSTSEGFKAAFGLGAPSQAEAVEAHDSLKSALVALLVESPTFAGESALVASR
jgi:hypothetical protein